MFSLGFAFLFCGNHFLPLYFFFFAGVHNSVVNVMSAGLRLHVQLLLFQYNV